jgi:hypothetical protein
VDQTLTNGDQAKHEHAERQPDVWLEPFEDHIAGYFEDDIWHEENREGGVVLIRHQFEVLRKAKDGGIRDVGAIQESEEIQEGQDGNHSEINLGDELALVDMGRRRSMVFNVGWMAQIRVIKLALNFAGAISPAALRS